MMRFVGTGFLNVVLDAPRTLLLRDVVKTSSMRIYFNQWLVCMEKL